MMKPFTFSAQPKILPPLDADFRPAVLANQAYLEAIGRVDSPQLLVIALERAEGSLSRYETVIFPEDHPDAAQSLFYVERIVKFLLWQRGCRTLYIGGSEKVGQHIHRFYSSQGARNFDFEFMSQVYDKPLEVISCRIEDVPRAREQQRSLGRNLSGNRIGFDLGASDLKVSAVVNGEAVFSAEIEWHPVEQTDPDYHRQKIKAALDLAASKMTHVDAIGGSSAGVYIHNRPMIASLYRSIPPEKFDQIHNLFLDLGDEMGVPLEIVNDGEVTALAGSMSLGENGILGIAMGSSEAVGYITPSGDITDWLNELAFAPIDYQTGAPVDEWSQDQGVGALYLSQQCVFRLAPKLGIEIPSDLTNTQKLKFVQDKLEAGEDNANKIWESMGVYLGYAIAHYADFYEIHTVLILGRCTSGRGGTIIRDYAGQVLECEFPELAAGIKIQLPDEKSRRVGQSIAAASLPKVGQQ